MSKHDAAPTPPMGWNSYDYYDTTVNEAQIKANADYMARHLKDERPIPVHPLFPFGNR